MAKMPAIVVGSTRRSGGKRAKPAVKTAGMMAPPQKPWITRKRRSRSKFGLSAAPRLAKVNPLMATTKSPRSESRRVRRAVSGIAMISAMR